MLGPRAQGPRGKGVIFHPHQKFQKGDTQKYWFFIGNIDVDVEKVQQSYNLAPFSVRLGAGLKLILSTGMVFR